MERRKFLAASLLAGIFGHPVKNDWINAIAPDRQEKSLPRRRYRDDIDLSVLGFGGIVVVGMTQPEADRAVARAVERGINYFDVAPSYGEGEAQEKLGPALAPHRAKVFLACKTLEREADGAEKELANSLRVMKTDHFDLYQFHAVTRIEDVDRIFARGGAMETFLRARDRGTIRYIGFSAHSETAALAMMDRFAFDSVLFPVNLICYARGNFGPAVVARAKKEGTARLALKMLARGPRPTGPRTIYPKAWYQPIDDPEEAQKAVRFTLSEDITAAIPPGDIRLLNLAIDLASEFRPLTEEERTELLEGTRGIDPLFRS